MITIGQIKSLATLARLGMKEAELKTLKKDLEGILAYVGILQKVDVAGVKPLSHSAGLKNRPREDGKGETLSSPGELLRGVPQTKKRWVKVVRVVKREA